MGACRADQRIVPPFFRGFFLWRRRRSRAAYARRSCSRWRRARRIVMAESCAALPTRAQHGAFAGRRRVGGRRRAAADDNDSTLVRIKAGSGVSQACSRTSARRGRSRTWAWSKAASGTTGAGRSRPRRRSTNCAVGGLVARLGGLALDAERRAALGERRHLWRSRCGICFSERTVTSKF